MEQLQRDIRFLKRYAVIMTLLLGIAIVSGFRMASEKTNTLNSASSV